MDYDTKNGPGIAVRGADLLVAARVFASDTQKEEVHVLKHPFEGDSNFLAAEQDVPDGSHLTPIGAGGGKFAFVYVNDDSYTMKLVQQGSSSDVTLDTKFDNEVQVVVDGTGEAHVVWRKNFGQAPLVHWNDYAEKQITSKTAGVPDLAVDDKNRVHVVYLAGTDVYWQVFDGAAWSAEKKIGTGKGIEVAIAAASDDFVYAAWRTSSQEIEVARLAGGAWASMAKKTLVTSSDSIKRLELEADAHGVTHAGAVLDPLTGPDYVVFATVCGGGGSTCTPSCTGKECGPDGCGGTCGTCTSGKTCNDAGKCIGGCVPSCAGKSCGSDGCSGTCGTCQPGQTCDAGVCKGGTGACGADPTKSCKDKCGKWDEAGQGWLCNCDSKCASYGDCCPDLAACCGS